MPGARLKQRYLIGRLPLAHHGMGEVWPAEDTVLQRQVIVKVLPPTDDLNLVRRFSREAKLTARFQHPGVPRVFDLDTEGGRPYLVLERIDGLTLTDLAAEQGPLPIAWVAAIGMQVCAVLMAAQEFGLVHRDIKPSNVMLEPSGGVKVLDFGLAAAHQDDRYSRITETGLSLGTVGYMAPEQVHGGPTDHRTDLYGLGGILFHLLTTEPPFDGATTMTTLRHQLAAPPPRPTALRPDVPAPLDELIHTLLAADPAQRPASAVEVYLRLAPFAQPRPALPGAVVDGDHPVLAYAAALAGAAVITGRPAAPRSGPTDEDEAERLFAAGEVRAAAQRWRHLAEQRARDHGEDDERVFHWRLRAARAHVGLGERSRALRQLDSLLQRRIQVVGPDHRTVGDLRREIDDLRPTRD